MAGKATKGKVVELRQDVIQAQVIRDKIKALEAENQKLQAQFITNNHRIAALREVLEADEGEQKAAKSE